MEKLICKFCGKPLIKAFELTDEEKKELIYLNSVQDTLDKCLSNFNTDLDKKLKNCIKRIFAKKAEEFISRKEFIDNLSKKYNVSDYEIIDGVIYVHAQEN